MRLTVVIPTLNESDRLGRCVRAVRECAVAGAPEVIVADCGSRDGTAELAASLGARLVTATPPFGSRAEALEAGATAADTEALLFLHADCEPPPRYDEQLLDALARTGVVGGAFEFALIERHPGLRWIERINRLRYRVFRRYYGDQGIFCLASALRAVGGIPRRRILEDSELSRRLRGVGRMTLLRAPMHTSGRRFLEGGILRVLARDVRIWWADAIGLPTERFAEDYRRYNVDRASTRDRVGTSPDQ